VAARISQVRLLPAREAPVDPRLDGHVHALPTMICCLHGTTRTESASATIDLHPGEAVVIAPGAWHRHAPLRAQSAIYAQGLMARRSDVLLMHSQRRWWLTIPEQPSRRSLYHALQATSDDQRVVSVIELMSSFAREPAMAMTMSPSQVAMAHYLWGNFTRDITASDILRSSTLSRAQAHLSFRTCFHETPKQALTHARLALAEHLEREGFTPSEVARTSGFVSSARWRRTQRRVRQRGDG
jgi:hypothetical protein